MTWLPLALSAATILVAFEPRALGGLVDLVQRAGRPLGLGGGLAPRVPLAISVIVLVLCFGLAVGIVEGLGGGVSLPPYRLALAAPLLVLAVLDARAYWLPFSVTVPLVVLGLASAWFDGTILDAVAGCVLWGAIPWGIEVLFRRWRGFPGLGFGDIVLMAAVGAWAGATAGAIAIVLACVIAVVVIWEAVRPACPAVPACRASRWAASSASACGPRFCCWAAPRRDCRRPEAALHFLQVGSDSILSLRSMSMCYPAVQHSWCSAQRGRTG